MSWLPFSFKGTLQSIPMIDTTNAPSDEWSPAVMFEVMRVATARHKAKGTVPSWAGQVLLDQLQQVSQRYESGALPLASANRYSLGLLQHLMHVRSQRGWRLSPAVVRQLDLRWHVLPGMRLAKITFIACDFDDSDLSLARFQQCEFRGCSFRRANLSLADFQSSRIVGCNFEDATLEAAKGLG